VTALEAQAELEKGLAHVESFDEAVLWLKTHPEVANNLTPMGLVESLGDGLDNAVHQTTYVVTNSDREKP